MLFRSAGLAASLALALLAPASAQDFDVQNPESVASTLKELGYRASLTRAAKGQPVIRSAAGGINFDIYFYDCIEDRDCLLMQVTAGFTLDEAADPSAIRNWNLKRLFGRAYTGTNPREVFFDHIVIVSGGLSRETFDSILATWGTVVSDYADAIGYR